MHYGSRLAFGPDGMLFITTGERSDAPMRKYAQDPRSQLGKVVRINADGSIPKDNPFVGRQGARPEIWSYGHRNPQAAALDPQTDKLWVVEHGPRGGDEINIPKKGKNYGWPLASYGVHYSGEPVGKGTGKAPGTEQPIHHWTPSIAPSGMAFYTGDLFPDWKGDLFVGALKAKELVRLDVSETAVNGEEAIKLGHRIRDVRQGPDGALYLLTDEDDGKVLRLAPKP
jgi:glucose/arabinose dehydrogenase